MNFTQQDIFNMLKTYERKGVISKEKKDEIVMALQQGKSSPQLIKEFNEARHRFLAGSVFTLSIVSRILIDLLIEISVDKEFYQKEFKQQANTFLNALVKKFDTYYQKANEETKENGAKIAITIQDVCYKVPTMDYKKWITLIEVIKEIQTTKEFESITTQEYEKLKDTKQGVKRLQEAIDLAIKERDKLAKSNASELEYKQKEAYIQGLTAAKIHLGLK